MFDKNLKNKNQQQVSLNLFSADEGFVKGNLFKDLYQGYKGFTPQLIAPTNLEEAMMYEIQKFAAASHDLVLFLDNNPDNKEAIDLFNKYQQHTKDAINNYEKEFGPISLSSDKLKTMPWAWHKTKWPWEVER